MIAKPLACRWLGLVGLWLAACAPERAPSLLLISLDTVRYDHLPIYGYGRDTTPALRRLAAESAVFENAFAQDTNTNPSHTSMFTGVYPNVHGSQSNGKRLEKGQVTLAQILRAAGFRTAAFVSSPTLHRKASGLGRGFDVYDDDFPGVRRPGSVTTGLAIDAIRRLQPAERYFVFLHLYDAHGPYDPGPHAGLFRSERPGPWLRNLPDYQRAPDAAGNVSGRLNAYIDRYDGSIRHLDDMLAALLAEVDLDSTIVVVIADHGETFGERFWGLDHGAQLFDEQVRIPLILHGPGIPARRIGAVVETVSLLPTLLELLGVELPAKRPVQGESLVPLLIGAAESRPGLAFSSARADEARHADRGYRLDPDRQIQAVRSPRWKLIQYPGRERDYLELYDLASDPRELSNVAPHFAGVRDELLEILEHWSVEAPTGPSPDLDPEIQEKLQALGYLQ